MAGSRRPADDGPIADSGGSIRAEFDWSDVPPSTAVIETVAIATDRDPMEMEPLYDTIDLDALDGLMCPIGGHSNDGDATVTFALDGYQITVRRAGSVVVRPTMARA